MESLALNPPARDTTRAVALLLNIGHAIDHMFLLIFATAVGTIAAEFGFARWEDLMPYGVGAFVLFGLGSLPAGRLGDLWGRRRMMLVFFFGIGVSALLAALTRNAWQLAATLTLLGAFAAIYHPVGIPMLLQSTRNPGAVIGVNGLSGNLGIAVAALSTGFMVQWFGWRAAFALPGLVGHDPWKTFDAITLEIGHQMMLTGDWVVPRVAGQPLLDNPPLFHWLALAFGKLLGGLVPFLIIDLVVASLLMSMGMMMLPPITISLPFKLIFFVLVDGWSLVMGTLAASFFR